MIDYSSVRVIYKDRNFWLVDRAGDLVWDIGYRTEKGAYRTLEWLQKDI